MHKSLLWVEGCQGTGVQLWNKNMKPFIGGGLKYCPLLFISLWHAWMNLRRGSSELEMTRWWTEARLASKKDPFLRVKLKKKTINRQQKRSKLWKFECLYQLTKPWDLIWTTFFRRCSGKHKGVLHFSPWKCSTQILTCKVFALLWITDRPVVRIYKTLQYLSC